MPAPLRRSRGEPAVEGLDLLKRGQGEEIMNHRRRAYVDVDGAWRLTGSDRLVATAPEASSQ